MFRIICVSQRPVSAFKLISGINYDIKDLCHEEEEEFYGRS